jgi:hypothetical protein
MDFTFSFGLHIPPWLLFSTLTALAGGIGATVRQSLIAARSTASGITPNRRARR